MMNKELEALKILKTNAILFDDGTDFGASMLEAITVLDKALTLPPTEQEVCKALSEYFRKEIQYENGDFYYQHMITKPKQYISIKRKLAFSEKIVYTIETQLPPHLITMLGRFYEGLEETKE